MNNNKAYEIQTAKFVSMTSLLENLPIYLQKHSAKIGNNTSNKISRTLIPRNRFLEEIRAIKQDLIDTGETSLIGIVELQTLISIVESLPEDILIDLERDIDDILIDLERDIDDI